MRLLVSTIFGGLCLFSSAALAQECDRSDETQQGMNICAGEDYDAADQQLNEAYGRVVKSLADSPEDKKLLQVAQRAWIVFRDAQCDFSTNPNKQGSAYPMLYVGCQQALTEARTKQFEAYLNCEENNEDCDQVP